MDPDEAPGRAIEVDVSKYAVEDIERIFREWTGGTPASIRVLLAELDRLRAALAERDAEIARLRAALDAVRERHAKYDDGTCWEDGKDWPCPTVRALAAVPAPAEDCPTPFLHGPEPCPTCQVPVTFAAPAPAREQADPADEEGECPPICGALGSIHGPGHPCIEPPGHTLHRDGVGCSWAEPDTPAEDETVNHCGVCNKNLIDANTSELHWGLCEECFKKKVDE